LAKTNGWKNLRFCRAGAATPLPPRKRKKEKTYPVVLEPFEFIRRFLLHILPPGFMKIRFYGFLSHTNKKQALSLIRKSLNQAPPAAPTDDELKETAAEKILRLTGLDIAHCPKCGEKLVQARKRGQPMNLESD